MPDITSNNPPWLFASQQEAHDDLMQIAAEVIREIVSNGHQPPSFKRFDRDTRELWSVMRLFAPADADGRRL